MSHATSFRLIQIAKARLNDGYRLLSMVFRQRRLRPRLSLTSLHHRTQVQYHFRSDHFHPKSPTVHQPSVQRLEDSDTGI